MLAKPYHGATSCYRFSVTATVLSTAHLPIDIGPYLGGLDYFEPSSGELARCEILEEIRGARALISLLSVRVDEELLDAAPNLKVVANYAVGYDNVDVAAASERGIIVTNTPDVLTEATADFAFALLMASARRLGEGERLLRCGAWMGWLPTLLLGQPIHGRCLGVVGAGRIGQAMLRRGRGFGMPLLYSGPRPVAQAEALGARRCSTEELLASSDFVSLHCPLNRETRHLIDAEALSRMKESAVLVNTSRGGCVDSEALARALKAGLIAGAGLDVFEGEPGIPASLLECEAAVLAPHIGSATHEARQGMARICAEAVAAVLSGKLATTALNPEAVT
ncbi:MAG: D-glycerate dehydrogenase [Myxococcales bacterium]|nr:D-glycerate dehydrogenase [Myxococcales bacterium]